MYRVFLYMVLVCACFTLTCCKSPVQSEPSQEHIKIGDISPPNDNKVVGKPINTINLDVHVFEIPSENSDEISDVWGLLQTEPLRFHNQKTFIANSFVVRFGRVRMLDRINDMLQTCGGQKIVTVSLLIPEGQTNDFTVKAINTKQNVSFIAENGRGDETTIGPGTLGLRIKAEKIPGLRDVCELVTYPVFTVPAVSSIPQLSIRATAREFNFSSAAFGLRMAPGDFILLGPEKYDSSQKTLDSLLFSNPEGSFFSDIPKRMTPVRKSSVRVFLLVCIGMSN